MACDSSGASPSARNADASRARSSITGDGSGSSASAATASAAESVETGAGAWRRQAEELRERAQDDDAVVEQVERGLSAVLEVGLVDDQRARVGKRPQLAGWIVRAAGEREHRVDVADLRARELRGDPKERIGRRLRDGDRVARAGVGPRAEQDQVVGARAEHDVLRFDARVVGDRAA